MMAIGSASNTNAFYMSYAMCAAIFVAALIFSSPALLAASCVMLLAAAIMLHLGSAINSLLIKRSALVIVSGNYSIGRNLASISRKEGDSYRSISIALLKPRPASEINGKPLRELLDSLSEHFEFSVELAEADKSKILENLRTRARMKEIALSRLAEKSHDKAALLRRQIDLINGDISSLANAGKSFGFVIRLKSICASQDQAEAESSSARGIEMLAGKFSATLGVDYEILRGEELLGYSGV